MKNERGQQNITTPTYLLDIRNPVALVCSLIEWLCGNAHISLEGDLSNLDHTCVAGIKLDEWSVLRRNTIWPRQDFIILPLETETTKIIKSRILHTVGLRDRVIHVQIEKGEELVFCAFDNFAAECVWIAQSVGDQFLQDLIGKNVLRSFKSNPYD
ncbi:MAG: hypothetical protein ACE5EQ_00755 [Phycisphaerae bacterium]